MSAIYPNVNDYLDSRNQGLWDQLKANYEISLAFREDEIYSCDRISTSVIFHVSRENPCKDSFTHELLHIYFALKGLYIGNHLRFNFLCEETLREIYTSELLDHIGNCLEHFKMLPIYLRLGFQREKFISDFHTLKCTPELITSSIRLLNMDAKYLKSAGNLLIGKYFAIKACPNKSLDYSSCLQALQKEDGQLYAILEKFWASWEDFDVEKIDPVHNHFLSMCGVFIETLEGWAANKKERKNSFPAKM